MGRRIEFGEAVHGEADASDDEGIGRDGGGGEGNGVV